MVDSHIDDLALGGDAADFVGLQYYSRSVLGLVGIDRDDDFTWTVRPCAPVLGEVARTGSPRRCATS